MKNGSTILPINAKILYMKYVLFINKISSMRW